MHHSFLTLYEKCFDDIYRFIYMRTNNKWDCDDLVGETFRKAYEKYNAVLENPRSWLFTIARNTVYDFYRKKQPELNIDEVELYTYPLFDEKLEIKDELNCLKKALKTLKAKGMEVISLKYFSSLNYEEIGHLTGRTRDAVKMSAHRIGKKLGILISKCLEV